MCEQLHVREGRRRGTEERDGRWIGCGRSPWEIIAEFSREMGVLREIGAAEVLRDGA